MEKEKCKWGCWVRHAPWPLHGRIDHVTLQKRPGAHVHYAGKNWVFRVISTLNKGAVKTQRWVGVHRKSALDDSHLLYGQKVFWVGFMTKSGTHRQMLLTTIYGVLIISVTLQCVSHLTMYKTVTCYLQSSNERNWGLGRLNNLSQILKLVGDDVEILRSKLGRTKYFKLVGTVLTTSMGKCG